MRSSLTLDERRPEHDPKPLRQQWIERREAAARSCGWIGRWPPQKPKIRSGADCECVLARLESGEERASLVAALAVNLVRFCEELGPDTFRRFGVVVMRIAENPRAWHRVRRRAVEAPTTLLRNALAVMRADHSRSARLVELLCAFLDGLSADGMARLAQVLLALLGPAARTSTDTLRAVRAAVGAVMAAPAMLEDIRWLERKEADERETAEDPKVAEAMRRLREVKVQAGCRVKRRARHIPS